MSMPSIRTQELPLDGVVQPHPTKSNQSRPGQACGQSAQTRHDTVDRLPRSMGAMMREFFISACLVMTAIASECQAEGPGHDPGCITIHLGGSFCILCGHSLPRWSWGF